MCLWWLDVETMNSWQTIDGSGSLAAAQRDVATLEGEIDALRRILAGVSCAAVGLLISVVFKMMMPLIRKRDAIGLLILVAVFIAIGLVRLPLQAVLLVAIPLSLGITFFMRRRVIA